MSACPIKYAQYMNLSLIHAVLGPQELCMESYLNIPYQTPASQRFQRMRTKIEVLSTLWPDGSTCCSSCAVREPCHLVLRLRPALIWPGSLPSRLSVTEVSYLQSTIRSPNRLC